MHSSSTKEDAPSEKEPIQKTRSVRSISDVNRDKSKVSEKVEKHFYHEVFRKVTLTIQARLGYMN